MRVPGVEPGSIASEATTLSIVLHSRLLLKKFALPPRSVERKDFPKGFPGGTKLRCASGRFFIFPPSAPALDDHGEHGQDDDSEDDEFEVFLDQRVVAEGITRVSKRIDPEESADDVIGEKLAVIHLPDACHERHKGAHDGGEPCENNCPAAIFFKKNVGTLQVFFAEENESSRLKTAGPSFPPTQ